MSKDCQRCGICCTYILVVPAPHYIPLYEKHQDWLNLHGVELVEVEAVDGLPDFISHALKIKNKCTELLPDGSCGIHETKPENCRRFPVGLARECPLRKEDQNDN